MNAIVIIDFYQCGNTNGLVFANMSVKRLMHWRGISKETECFYSDLCLCDCAHYRRFTRLFILRSLQNKITMASFMFYQVPRLAIN